MSDPFRLDGLSALVTGASSGLGRHFARTLARAGADVAVAARRAGRLAEVAADITAEGRRAAPITLDVTDAKSVRKGVEQAEATLGPIAILVNNAGIAVTRPLLEHSEADWDAVLDTDLKGAWLVAQACAARMAARGAGGSIVNIASLLAFRVTPQLPSYAAAKAGLVHLTRAMAVELARHDIRVNAIAPGYVETDMNREYFASEAGERMVKRIPMRRVGQPRELDGALLLLASEAGRYMTGSVITVDGGHSVNAL